LKTITLQILGVGIDIHCADDHIRNLLLSNFGAMQTPGAVAGINSLLSYNVDSEGTDLFCIRHSEKAIINNADVYDLIYFLEKHITVELQKIRKDLLFIHAAALEYNGKAGIIVAPSGSGKSTTSWALLHHGFRYLSDELSPIDLSTMSVFSYPHALCLKSDPPESYPLPNNVIRTAATIHVPVDFLPAKICEVPVCLAAIFFLKYDPDLSEPTIQQISAAEASARLYSNALNPLAHPEGGIDAGIAVARKCARFNVASADLTKTVKLIKSTMEGLLLV
jgi:hypothetical protein